MKKYIKYLCAVLMIIGTSAHAWGTGIYLEYNSTKYYNGDMITINLAQTTLPAHGSPSMTVGNNAGWTQDTNYRYGIITTTWSGTPVPSNVSFLMGSYTPSAGTAVGNANETSYYTYNATAQYWNASFQVGYYFNAAGTYDAVMTVTEKDQSDGTTVLQSATITVRFVVTFSGYTITYNLSGIEHANAYNPTATSGAFHAAFELEENYSTPIIGTYSDGFVTNAPITIGTSGDCYYNLGDLYYNSTPSGNITINLTATLTCTELAAPGSLTLSQNHDATHGKTRFGWNSVANASGYEVTVSNGVTTNSVTTASDRYYYITTFPTGNYTWSVKALGDGSTYCEENDATDGTPFCVGADLSAVTPSNLAVSEVTNTTATISWDEVVNAVGYELLLVDGEETTIDDYSGSGTSWEVTGLTAGTTYTIWWQAINSCDDEYNSDIDKSVSFTTTNNHTVSFNANGGSGSIDAVVRAHGTTYDLPACTMVAPSGKVFKCWAEGSAGGTERAVGYTHTVNADITFYAKWRDAVITDYVFSCSELTLTCPATDLVFITSTASQTVRSQEALHVIGSGLTPSTTLSFAISDPTILSKFAFKKADGSAVATDENGAIDTDFYIFYTPDGEDIEDGIDKFTTLTASVEETKPKSYTLTGKTFIGRHLPANFVIAAKKDNKWYAIPDTMTALRHPKPVEIAVDDIDNPTIAYTATSNYYKLYGQKSSNDATGSGQLYTANGVTVKLGMTNNATTNAPLFGSASPSTTVGKSGTATITNNIGVQYWWKLVQTNATITSAADAKYKIYSANNVVNENTRLRLRENAGKPDWGLFTSGVDELRLIPVSDIPFTEAYFVEWGQHGGVIEVDAEGIDANSVTATLNGTTRGAISFAQTQTSGKGRASIYDYTVNFGGSIDFAAAASNGALLTLKWTKNAVVKAVTSIVVPKIIATSGDMKTIMSGDAQWETEVHVLPGVTLTANGGSFESSDVRINLLEIYPGAVVKVTTGTLNVASLVLRNGWTRAGTKKFDVARLHIASTANLTKANSTDGWYSDWYVDYDQYYSISVPWEVTLANVKYRYCSVEPTVGGDDGNIRLRYYDGEQRASTAQSQIGKNWKDYGKTGNKDVPSKLLPSMGYAMNAKRPSGKAFSIIRMPMDFPGNEWTALGEKGEVSSVHKNQVTVTGWGYGTSTPWYAMGWNFIGNPYMCEFSGNDDGITGKMELQNGGSIRYATIPDEGFKNFDQVNIATEPLKPASGFFIQANSASEETITFNANKIVPPSAPARYMTQTETIPEQEAYIRLSYEGGRDQMGLIIGEDYTAAYEVNADLAKVLGDAGYVKTYMRYEDMDMAYVAINAMLAKEWIPVTVILPTAGEYTYSLMSSSEVEHLDGVYLIDYTTNEITNLIENDYVFTATAGTFSNRFAINAKVGERETPTTIDVVGMDKDSKEPIKFLWHDKVFIWFNGVIYDATGKKVK